jgi:glutamine amidotransferase/cyclase
LYTVFENTKAETALAAGIFHREEVPIEAVKEHMRKRGIETR